MGFYIYNLNDEGSNDYIGTQTMYSCADNGAFDCEVNNELADYAEQNEGIMAVVDKNGIDQFLNILKSGVCNGRDIQKFIDIVESKYMDGFIMRS